jgi:uncharacterized membrane protein YbhN (UPF0104 family)
MSRISRALRTRLGTLAGACLLAVLLWRLGTGAFLDGLRAIDGPTLLAALGLGLLTTVFSAWRWCLVARALDVRLPLGGAVASYYRALFLNAALPGGLLGDVHRAVRHGQDVGDVGRGVRAVVLERTAGQAVLVTVGVTVLVVRPTPALAEAGRATHRAVTMPGAGAAVATAVAVAGCVLLALAVVRLREGAALPRWRRTLGAELAEARRALLARASWPGVLLSSVVALAGHLAMFLLAARVAGSTASAAELLPLMLMALLAMGLPLNIGGWGPREGVTAWAFGAAGLGASLGLTVAVVYGVLAFAASLPGIAVLAGQWFAGRRRAQVQLEERVLADGGAPDAGAKGVPHQLGSGEADPGDAVTEQDRRHGHVEPVQRPFVQDARHGDTAALDQHPAQAAPRELPHQIAGRERVAVRQDQHVDSGPHSVGDGPRVLAAGAHHPQGGG